MIDTLPIQVLQDDKAPTLALLAVIIHKYGVMEAITWDPVTMKYELEDDFNIELSELQTDKIQLGLSLLASDIFESQYEVFAAGVNILNCFPTVFTDFIPIEAEDIAIAIAEVDLLNEGVEVEYSDEVKKFAGLIFSAHGLSQAPSIFPEAIMPEHTFHDEIGEKDEALTELYNAKQEYIKVYMEKLKLTK
jgi:hypothetical protein